MNHTALACVFILFASGLAAADPQPDYSHLQQGQPPQQNIKVPPSRSDNVLELAPLVGAQLPPPPPVAHDPEIPSPFLGCWEGTPDRFDSVVSSFGSVTIGAPGRIVFCYRADRIEVAEAKVDLNAGDWMKNVAVHLGLGLTLIRKIDTGEISTQIYGITQTQIHARTFIPLHVTELFFWVLPAFNVYMLVDEELATLKDPDTLMVEARQEVSIPGAHSVRMWHADFHRTSPRIDSAR